MYKKLVKCNRGYFEEVDPVRLKRKAMKLRDQIFLKVSKENDPFEFYSRTLPIVDAAINGQITKSLDNDSSHFIHGNYNWNEREGTLPPEYDKDFEEAVAGFLVTVEALSLESHEKITKDGNTYAWLDFEEESDWPDKVKFP